MYKKDRLRAIAITAYELDAIPLNQKNSEKGKRDRL